MKNVMRNLLIVVAIIAIILYAYSSGALKEPKKILCTPQDTNQTLCITLYKPVCGWFDTEKVNCVKYTCAQTFSNSCFACSDEKVKYYTEGQCFG